MDSYLLPCPFKYLIGLDCPGCGFQRSVIALLSGDLKLSLSLYPPAIPLLVSVLFAGYAALFRKNMESKYLKVCYMITGFVIIINYTYKIFTHQLH